MPPQLSLLPQDTREADIDAIHRATAIYTVAPEIEALLDRLSWPLCGGRLLDPGAGNGGFVVAALKRLVLTVNDVQAAADRVKGYEFHAGAASVAREHVAGYLRSIGWASSCAADAAGRIIEVRDFLLSPVPVGTFHVIAKNAPYLRLANLPEGYRRDFEAQVDDHARGDLLHAFLQKSADVLAPGGVIGMISSDRWLLNEGPAELRRRLGERFAVRDIQRLDSTSTFYRPKARTKGTPARVHPVSLVLDPSGNGTPLTAAPFPIDGQLEADGVALSRLVSVRLAPYVGPEGIFVVRSCEGLPASHLVPCVEPDDIHPTEDRLTGHRRWVIATKRGEEPPREVRDHLAANMSRMPRRGQRNGAVWLPPEPFAGKLPLATDAVMVPRIARRLRPIPLPAGTMPINHNILVASGHGVDQLVTWLNHPTVQAQAERLALRLENGFLSFTPATVRALKIPFDLVPAAILETLE